MRKSIFGLVLGAAAALAQSPSGAITGTILDALGASVPAAEVVARHVDTNISYRARSSDAGVYVIPALPVGRFEVTAQAAGFKSFLRRDIVLEVAQRLRIDIALTVGDVTESVTVTGEVARVQTEESSLGTTVERQRIENLPINGRMIFNLMKVVAGVQPRGSNDGFGESNPQSFSQIRFNGGPVFGNQIFLDGGANTAQVHGEISVVPLVDAVEEFKVETNSIKAEFGQTNGGIINVVTRAGTNQFHGSLYEFVRNDAFDARNAFATQRDSISGRIKPLLRYNQFGGTVGGPVLIPKLYQGRNRTFFFFGYEEWRHRTAAIRRGTVATPQERGGDFSNTRDATGRLISIYDPATTRANPAGAGFVRDIFAGNVVPRNRMDPLSLRVLEHHPLPNARPDNAFTNLNNFLAIIGSPTDQKIPSIRVDHNISERDRVFGRYSSTYNKTRNNGFGLGPADPSARHDNRKNHNAIVSHTHTFSPALLNEIKLSAVRSTLPFIHPSFDGGWPAKLGFPSSLPQDMFPPVVISGLLSISNPSNTSGGQRNSSSVQAADSMTWIKGRHTVKAGFDHRWVRLNWINRRFPSGRFDFGTGLTGNPLAPAGTGFGLATYLLGEVTGGEQRFTPHFSFHNWTNATFVQDDFKITRRLTLNIGLRYDLVSGPAERWDRFSNFEPYTRNAQTGLDGKLTYAAVDHDRHFVTRNHDKIGPRFGFAYDLTGDGKTSVRGGYGIIFAGVDSGDTEGDTSNSLGFTAVTTFDAIGPTKAFQFSAGPAALNRPLGPAGGPSAFRGQDVRVQVFDAPSPYLQQWNFTLQRAVPGGWTISTAYAGNRVVKGFGANYDLNQLDPRHYAVGLALQNLVPNPFRGQIATGPLAGATIPRSQSLKTLPDYLAVTTLANHGASTTYHSTQITLEKRYSKGLTALVSYTGSKLIGDSFTSLGSGGGALLGVQSDLRIGAYNRRLDRSLDPEDITHRMVISGVWELPFGPGKALLGGSRGVTAYLVRGWQVNSVTTIQTGVPLAVRGANNFTGVNYPDVLSDPTLPRGERTPERWFNTSVFRNPVNFVIGNGPRTLPGTRGPGLFDMALSAFRDFQIREQAKIEFRVESFNAPNHVNYSNPGVSFAPGPDGLNRNAAFGRITSALGARTIQLGLRLVF